jgi:hypothetical protein
MLVSLSLNNQLSLTDSYQASATVVTQSTTELSLLTMVALRLAEETPLNTVVEMTASTCTRLFRPLLRPSLPLKFRP